MLAIFPCIYFNSFSKSMLKFKNLCLNLKLVPSPFPSIRFMYIYFKIYADYIMRPVTVRCATLCITMWEAVPLVAAFFNLCPNLCSRLPHNDNDILLLTVFLASYIIIWCDKPIEFNLLNLINFACTALFGLIEWKKILPFDVAKKIS